MAAEEEVIRWRIHLLVYGRRFEELNSYLMKLGLNGYGVVAEQMFREQVAGIKDHDLQHFWLEETCPCQMHPN